MKGQFPFKGEIITKMQNGVGSSNNFFSRATEPEKLKFI
jgi:hypothetical protein